MAQFLAANTSLTYSAGVIRDMRPTSRIITSLLAAVTAVFAVSAMIGAPVAVAQSCKPDQVWLAGECWDPPADGSPLPEPKLITEHGPASGATQHSR
jgi:hypothetical protein